MDREHLDFQVLTVYLRDRPLQRRFIVEELLNAKKAAEILCVPLGTIRAWTFQKLLPCVHLGRAVRYRSEDIETIRQKGLARERNG